MEESYPPRKYLEEERIYSVSEVNRLADNQLKGIEIWVEGEVCDLRLGYENFGFFSLRDELAVLPCVIFGEALRSLPLQLQEGISLLARGVLGIYVKKGQYRLNVLEAEESGEGRLRKEFLRLFRKLSEEGLFSDEIKRPLPEIPFSIGVISSVEGAAVRDVITNIRKRFPPASIYLRSVRVQGEGAVEEIVDAIDFLNRISPHFQIEVLIIARGGGSLEDLHAFNTEEVARAIRSSRIPVVTGIGHEPDYTIADFAADFRASTPTGAAQKVVPYIADIIHGLNVIKSRMESAWKKKLDDLGKGLEYLSRHRCFRVPEAFLLAPSQTLAEAHSSIRESWIRALSEMERSVQYHDLKIKGYARENRELPMAIGLRQAKLVQTIRWFLKERDEEMVELTHMITGNLRERIRNFEGSWRFTGGKLVSLNPLKALSRGYAIVYPEGSKKPLKDATKVSKGDQVDVTLYQGGMKCEVKDVIQESRKSHADLPDDFFREP